ncbi:hypothetical protein B566_EDAN005068 [Ephemera danica]|nr:hypothetical protein B566_EDAN005068 [Ephemera danica]
MAALQVQVKQKKKQSSSRAVVVLEQLEALKQHRSHWALFSYEGQSNDLKVVGTGDGGIEEMIEDLNSGKIMYGFVRVMDPKTGLLKCVLINWQGEGAPLVRKGICANHIHDVAKLFSGAHVTINARNEDEVDPQIIIEKVSKSVSVYSFNVRSQPENSPSPVGSIYKRVNPIQEINTSERDRFWEKEEMEEKQRQAEERRKKQDEQQKLEEERLKYEEKNRSMMQQREDQWNAKHPTPVPPARGIPVQKEYESQPINGDPTSSVPQASAPPPAFSNPPTSMQLPTNNGSSHVPMQISPDSATAEDEDNSEEQEWETHQEVQSSSTSHMPLPMEQAPVASDEAAYQAQAAAAAALTDGMAEMQYSTATPVQPSTLPDDDLGLRARALYDYQAADATEISFDPDDLITHIDMIDEGWWQGLGPDGTFGLFPANYVELLDE